MYIRKASSNDMEQIMDLYQMGRDYQRQVLNIIQWEDNYPSAQDLLGDIRDEQSYVVVDGDEEVDTTPSDETIIGTFFVQKGPDKVYFPLKKCWEKPEAIVTIHRVASHSGYKGVGNFIFTWLKKHCSNIMIDTHPQNDVMKYLIQKYEFIYLGVVTLEKGGLRNTYQWVKGAI